MAWPGSHFEMGEISAVWRETRRPPGTGYARVSGSLPRKRHQHWHRFFTSVEGEIALNQGEWADAQVHFDESYQLAIEFKHEWAAAYALSGLGLYAAGLLQFETARQRLGEGSCACPGAR